MDGVTHVSTHIFLITIHAIASDGWQYTFKLVILLKKKESLTDQGFAKYWLETHAPLAKQMPGLRKYVVNVVRRPPNKELDYHGMVELWFDDVDSMKKAFASPQGQATQKDTEIFTSGMVTLYIDEHIIT